VLVRLVTCRPLPEPDADEAPLLAALRAAGIDARMAVWDDPSETWEGGLSVIRSTWDYHLKIDAFLEWVARASRRSTLLNPPDVVRFSAHKRYLGELARAGLPVMPTVLLERGARADLADLMAERGWSDVVVKPAVSAASFRTARFHREEATAGQGHLDALLAERDVLIQPYLASVEGYGERAVVWIDGEVTHSVRKSPRFGGEHESVSPALEPSADERATAGAFVAHVGQDLLYARIDLARDEQGRPLLMELELVEPSLFLVQSPRALERLVRGIVSRARKT
jgi:glutathione synthase/RimK-type ligase-like ATP-grasp enzyme